MSPFIIESSIRLPKRQHKTMKRNVDVDNSSSASSTTRFWSRAAAFFVQYALVDDYIDPYIETTNTKVKSRRYQHLKYSCFKKFPLFVKSNEGPTTRYPLSLHPLSVPLLCSNANTSRTTPPSGY
jgi:hypothetical protein